MKKGPLWEETQRLRGKIEDSRTRAGLDPSGVTFGMGHPIRAHASSLSGPRFRCPQPTPSIFETTPLEPGIEMGLTCPLQSAHLAEYRQLECALAITKKDTQYSIHRIASPVGHFFLRVRAKTTTANLLSFLRSKDCTEGQPDCVRVSVTN